MEKIRVTFCMQQIITGGIEKCLVRILDKMCHMSEYELTVLVNNPVYEKYFLDFFAKTGIPLIEISNEFDALGEKPRNFLAKKIWKIRRFFFRIKHRFLIHRYLSNQDLIVDYFNCSFYPILKKLNIPKIGWYHSSFVPYSEKLDKNNKRFLTCYDKFVCLTDSFKEKLLKSAPRYSDKIVRMYNLIDTEEIKMLANDAPHPPTGEKYFVFVGRMHEDKDHLTVIEAFRKFAKKHTDAKIYFIGDGKKRAEYEQIVKKYKLDKNIIFTGILDNPLGYIKYATGNILSSPSEGLSVVLIEGALLKALNIASDAPDAAREILLNGNAGLLFSVGDSDDLCHLMTKVWENKIPIQDMIKTGFANISRFDANLVLPELDSLIKETVYPYRTKRYNKYLNLKKLLVSLLCAFIPSRKLRHKIKHNIIKNKIKPEIGTIKEYWLGRHSYYGANFIRMHPESTVGAFCSIGQNVVVGPSQHPTNWLSTSPFQYVELRKITEDQVIYPYSNDPTHIGNDVWIGNNAIIKDGVSVADGCIIASNAVVTHNTPPYAVLAGVPARVIRYRFSPQIISELMALKWWELPDTEIAKLPFNNIDACIEKLKEIRGNFYPEAKDSE